MNLILLAVLAFLLGVGCMSALVSFVEYVQKLRKQLAKLKESLKTTSQALDTTHQALDTMLAHMDDMQRAVTNRRTYADMKLFEDVVALLDSLQEEFQVQEEREISFTRQRAKQYGQFEKTLGEAIRRVRFGRQSGPLAYADHRPDGSAENHAEENFT